MDFGSSARENNRMGFSHEDSIEHSTIMATRGNNYCNILANFSNYCSSTSSCSSQYKSTSTTAVKSFSFLQEEEELDPAGLRRRIGQSTIIIIIR